MKLHIGERGVLPIRTLITGFVIAAPFILGGGQAVAATVTFDDLLTGQTSYGFDGDGDAINDVIFSTTDGSGFNTIGPGLNQLYIQEPGLEGTSLLPTDLSVLFLNGASGSLSFGFALNCPAPCNANAPGYKATFSVFDSANVLLGTQTVLGGTFAAPFGPSTFLENTLSLSFSGIAAYGRFDFFSPSRYIIDNFSGTFGSTEIPIPPAVWLFGSALGLMGVMRRKISS